MEKSARFVPCCDGKTVEIINAVFSFCPIVVVSFITSIIANLTSNRSNNLRLVAALPAFLTAVLTRSLMGTVIVGTCR
ncbi:AzlD domain-containing protein [Brevibacillus massiliensis]|uniref:AzlD domain-containing protein n=1 Tax=Brevibacillus massiliensis TaxID=1118054 RepID=UPI0011C7FCE5